MIALAGILAAATWSPGPNNAMLASSGATFGMRRTLPHVWGVGVGFGVMLFLVSLGLGEIFVRVPVLKEVLRYAGAALLLWVAWRIANSGRTARQDANRKPFTLLQAAGFQWINPKAWAMCAGVVAQFITGRDVVVEASIAAAVSMGVGLASAHAWAGSGALLQNWLSRGARLQLFNVAMAGMIVFGVLYLLTSEL